MVEGCNQSVGKSTDLAARGWLCYTREMSLFNGCVMRQVRPVSLCLGVLVLGLAADAQAWGLWPQPVTRGWSSSLVLVDGSQPQGDTAEVFDPIPGENPPSEVSGNVQSVSRQPNQREVVDIGDEDAFAALLPPQTPALPANDPRGDWLRLGAKVPAQPGEVAEVFPPHVELPPAPESVAPALKVLRHFPDGADVTSDVISVSFNQPLGELATLAQQGAGSMPLVVTPDPHGSFEWLGSGTLALRVAPRLPIATEFRVKVPAGALGSSGLSLSEEYSFGFRTNLPKVVTVSPYHGDVVGSRPEIVVQFNGAMDLQSVLAHVVLEGPKKVRVPLALKMEDVSARIAELKATDPAAARDLEWQSTSTVTLVPKAELKLATAYRLVVEEGILSLEGPLPGNTRKEVTFDTYSPLKLLEVGCGWEPGNKDPCEQWSSVNLMFNNELPDQKTSSLIRVTPAVSEMHTSVSGSFVTVSGAFEPGTTYTFTLKPGIKDSFGQTDTRGGRGKVTFGHADPEMFLTHSGHVIMEAAYAPMLYLQSRNLGEADVRFYPIAAEEVGAAVSALQRSDYTEHGAAKDAGLTLAKYSRLRLGGSADKWKLTTLDLQPYLGGKQTGVVLVEVSSRFKRYGEWERRLESALVQVTNLGLTSVVDSTTAHVMVSELSSGLPKSGVTVTVSRSGQQAPLGSATTDEQGFAHIPLPVMDPKESVELQIVASLGDDRTFEVLSVTSLLRMATTYDQVTSKPVPRMSALVFPERGAYRPGETVHLHAVARQQMPGPKGDLALVEPAFRECRWVIESPLLTKVAEGTAVLDAFGTTTLDHVLNKAALLGGYTVRFECSGVRFQGSFNVQEFRTPEFKTSVDWLGGNENILVYRKLGARISGSYLFGAPMAGARVEWRLARSRNYYRPPANEGFTFQDVRPEASSSPHDYYNPRERLWDQVFRSGEGVLDENGVLELDMDLVPTDRYRFPASFSLEAEVIDANSQSVAGRATVVAHWAERYVGLALSKAVVKAGESVTASAVVTRISGERLKAEATVQLLKTKWTAVEAEEDGVYRKEWKFEEVEVGRCAIQAGEEAGSCSLTPKEPGEYLIRASTKDVKGRPAYAAEFLWVAGETEPSWLGSSKEVELIPDKKEYQAGDTARILVRSPFQQARGVAFISREGATLLTPVEVRGGSATVEIPVEGLYAPSVSVEVALFQGRVKKPLAVGDPGMPSYASKRIQIPVSFESRRIRLELDVSPKVVGPGESVNVTVRARDAAGTPVKANVALALVDEGVLSLTQYETPNPLKALYQSRYPGTMQEDSRRYLVAQEAGAEALLQVRYEAGSGSGYATAEGNGKLGARKAFKAAKGGRAKSLYEFDEAMVEGESGQPAFYVRSLFATTAYYNGSLVTNDQGVVSVAVKMPDNLTRFRVMAVAADATNLLGSNDDQITTRLPFMVRPSLPRFLNLGDQFDAMALVTNVSGVDTKVKVKLMAANLDADGKVQTLDLPSGETRSVKFPAKAKAPGPATVRFAAVSMTRRPFTDAAEVTIPTLVPATAEATATYGVVEQTVRVPFEQPKDVLPEFGGLDVSLSSTALTGLQDALSYLVSYPYECSEQLSSRMLGIVSLMDILADFKIGGLESTEKAKQLLAQGVEKLLQYQRADGGFGFWKDSSFSWLHTSSFVLYALDTLRKAGIAVPMAPVRNLQSFISKRLDELARVRRIDSAWGQLDWEIGALDARALAVVAMARSGAIQQVARHLEYLLSVALKPFAAGEIRLDLPLYAGAWLAQALFVFDPKDPRLQQLLQAFNQAAVETPSSLSFAEGSYQSLRFMWHTTERTTALVLQTLLQVAPDSPLLEKSVRGLVKARVNGRWANTQANAFALMALNDYYRALEKAEPDFIARIWLGKEGALAHKFQGRSMEVARSLIPMLSVLEGAASDVTVGKEGTGRLYYRLGLRYSPKNLRLEALDRGFLVKRTYLKESEEKPLERDADGVWVAKQGEYVRVRLHIVAPDLRYFAAVVDPMPAGLESVNEAFATAAKSRPGNRRPSGERWVGAWWGWWNPWDYIEKRDDRVQLFQDRMYGGVYEYTYLAKATATGTFIVPPARAEEMYEPETFGRSATDTFRVVE